MRPLVTSATLSTMKIEEPQGRAHAIVVGSFDDETELRWRHPYASLSETWPGSARLRAKIAASDEVVDPFFVVRLFAVHRKLRRAAVPRVVRLEEVHRVADDQIALIYASVEGESVLDIMRRGPLPVAWTLEVLRQVCESIAAAHAVGVTHGAIGPASVVCHRLDDRPEVGLLDFGLASVARGRIDSELVAAHPVTPEAVLGGGTRVSEDIYQIGCLAYWMLSGVPPFDAKDMRTLRRRHAIEDPPRLDTLADPVRSPIADVVERALEKDADERFSSVRELGEMFARVCPAQRSPRQGTVALSTEELAAQAKATAPTVRPRSARRRTDIQFAVFATDLDEGRTGSHVVFARRDVDFDQAPAARKPRRARACMMELPILRLPTRTKVRPPFHRRMRSWIAAQLGVGVGRDGDDPDAEIGHN